MSKPRVFVLIPFRPEYEDLYMLIKQIAEGLDASVAWSGEFTGTTTIISQIYDSIKNTDVLACDISDVNPNVMYELGYAHAMRRPVIQICQKDAPIPFDVAMIRTLVYDRNSLLRTFQDQFSKTLQSVLLSPDAWCFGGTATQELKNRNLFISYSHSDKEYLNRLIIHLKPLEQEGLIDLWVDTKLSAGERWKARIEDSLRNAGVAILLISADFLSSDFIVNKEYAI